MHLCCTNFYRVPELLLFKQNNGDPLLITRINKCNTFIACPWTLWINDLDRCPTCRIPLMTRIPDVTLNKGFTASSCSDIMEVLSKEDMQMQQLPIPPYYAYLLQPLLLPALEALCKEPNFTPAPPISTMYLYSIIIEKYQLQERKHRSLPRISYGANTHYWEQQGRSILKSMKTHSFCLHYFQNNNGKLCSELFLPPSLPCPPPSTDQEWIKNDL